MPLLLAIDSGGDVFSVAAGATTAPPPDTLQQSNIPQAQCALPLIEAALARQGATVADCDAFAFAAGPGKFSALRLSCAIARTLAYATDKPLLAVPTFAALAQANYGSASALTIKCALPAHREHVYFASCRLQHGAWQVEKTALHACRRGIPAPAIGAACGAGYRQYPQLLGDAHYTETAPYSNALAVWQLAVAMLAAQAVSDPLHCEPFYLRRKVAETIHERHAGQTH